jgi:hypothetical protein
VLFFSFISGLATLRAYYEFNYNATNPEELSEWNNIAKITDNLAEVDEEDMRVHGRISYTNLASVLVSRKARSALFRAIRLFLARNDPFFCETPESDSTPAKGATRAPGTTPSPSSSPGTSPASSPVLGPTPAPAPGTVPTPAPPPVPEKQSRWKILTKILYIPIMTLLIFTLGISITPFYHPDKDHLQACEAVCDIFGPLPKILIYAFGQNLADLFYATRDRSASFLSSLIYCYIHFFIKRQFRKFVWNDHVSDLLLGSKAILIPIFLIAIFFQFFDINFIHKSNWGVFFASTVHYLAYASFLYTTSKYALRWEHCSFFAEAFNLTRYDFTFALSESVASIEKWFPEYMSHPALAFIKLKLIFPLMMMFERIAEYGGYHRHCQKRFGAYQ